MIISVIAIIMASLSKYSTEANKERLSDARMKIDSTNAEVKELRSFFQLTQQVSREISIDTLKPTNMNNVFCLEGQFKGSLSSIEDNSMLVLINEGNRYWIMKGDVIIQPNGHWFHNNVVLGFQPGVYKMLLVLCDRSVSDLIRKLQDLSNSPFFDGKPHGMKVVDSADIKLLEGSATILK